MHNTKKKRIAFSDDRSHTDFPFHEDHLFAKIANYGQMIIMRRSGRSPDFETLLSWQSHMNLQYNYGDLAILKIAHFSYFSSRVRKRFTRVFYTIDHKNARSMDLEKAQRFMHGYVKYFIIVFSLDLKIATYCHQHLDRHWPFAYIRHSCFMH